MKPGFLFSILAASLAFMTVVEAQQDTWVSVAPMPTARESVAACAVDGRIYALGGFPGGSDAGLTTNERYDPGTNLWSARAPMPTGRRMPATAVAGGKCYAIGGRITDQPVGMDVVEEYDPATNSWRARADMPTARYGHAAAAIDGIIYVVGGTHRGVLLGTLEAYNPATNAWTTLAPMPAPRALSGVVAMNGKLYVAGGTNDGAAGFSRLDIYDPGSNSWSRGASMPAARFGLSASVAGGRMHAVGGANGPAAVDDVTAYDPALDQWTAVSPLLTRRTRFASATVDGRIYAIGGAVSFDVPHVGMNLVERYTPAAGAPGFVVNAGLTDAWFDPATPGQGFLMVVFPETELLFLSWFTYETELRPDSPPPWSLGEPYHRWLTALGGWVGNTVELDVTMTSGGVFDQPGPVQNTPPDSYGSISIRFHDCNSATLEYDLFAPGESGEIALTRIVDDRIALCESLQE